MPRLPKIGIKLFVVLLSLVSIALILSRGSSSVQKDILAGTCVDIKIDDVTVSVGNSGAGWNFGEIGELTLTNANLVNIIAQDCETLEIILHGENTLKRAWMLGSGDLVFSGDGKLTMTNPEENSGELYSFISVNSGNLYITESANIVMDHYDLEGLYRHTPLRVGVGGLYVNDAASLSVFSRNKTWSASGIEAPMLRLNTSGKVTVILDFVPGTDPVRIKNSSAYASSSIENTLVSRIEGTGRYEFQVVGSEGSAMVFSIKHNLQLGLPYMRILTPEGGQIQTLPKNSPFARPYICVNEDCDQNHVVFGTPPKHNFTVECGPNGTCEEYKDWYYEGYSGEILVTPDAGYEVDTVVGAFPDGENYYSTDPLFDDHTVSITFKEIDIDGDIYSDITEDAYGTDKEDPESHPVHMIDLEIEEPDSQNDDIVSDAKIIATAGLCNYTFSGESVGLNGVVLPKDVKIFGGVTYKLVCAAIGQDAIVKIVLGKYFEDLTKLKVYKGSTNLEDITGKMTISNVDSKTTIVYKLVDGLDFDEDGEGNKEIIDPIFIGEEIPKDILPSTGAKYTLPLLIFGFITIVTGSLLLVKSKRELLRA